MTDSELVEILRGLIPSLGDDGDPIQHEIDFGEYLWNDGVLVGNIFSQKDRRASIIQFLKDRGAIPQETT